MVLVKEGEVCQQAAPHEHELHASDVLQLLLYVK